MIGLSFFFFRIFFSVSAIDNYTIGRLENFEKSIHWLSENEITAIFLTFILCSAVSVPPQDRLFLLPNWWLRDNCFKVSISIIITDFDLSIKWPTQSLNWVAITTWSCYQRCVLQNLWLIFFQFIVCNLFWCSPTFRRPRTFSIHYCLLNIFLSW